MGTPSSQQLRYMLPQLEPIIGQVVSGIDSNGKISPYLNSIFSGIASVDAISNGSHEEKVAGIETLIGTIFSLLTSLGANASAKASSDVKSNSSDINNTANDAEKLEAEIKGKITDFEGIFKTNNKIIDASITKINVAQQEIEMQQDEINAAIEIIKRNQEELKNSSLSKDEQIKLLKEIQEASGIINSAICTIAGLKIDIDAASSDVTKAIESIEETKGNTVTFEEEAQTQMTNIKNALTEEGIEAVNLENKGIVNGKESTETGVMAVVAGTNPVTAKEAPKLVKISGDRGFASSIRIAGSSANLINLVGSINEAANATELMGIYQNSVGSQLSNYDNLIGQWESTLTPLIKSIGSLPEFDSFELNKAVAVDMAQILLYNDQNANNATLKDDSLTLKKPHEMTQALVGGKYVQEQKPIELITPTVDIKAPQFGV